MSEQCLALVDSVKLANKKISMNDLLDLCDEYDLSPNEVDWVTNSLSAYLSDFDENSFEGVSDDDSLDDCIDLTDMVIPPILEMFISGLKSYSILMTSCKQTYQTSGKKTITHMRL